VQQHRSAGEDRLSFEEELFREPEDVGAVRDHEWDEEAAEEERKAERPVENAAIEAVSWN
jgi:hypothetical protein